MRIHEYHHNATTWRMFLRICLLAFASIQGCLNANAQNAPSDPNPDLAQEISQLKNYYSSLPDIQYTYTYEVNNNRFTGNFTYSQGRYMIDVSLPSDPKRGATLVFDGKRYMGLLYSRTYIRITSNPEQFEEYLPNSFQSNPLFNPVQVLFASEPIKFYMASFTNLEAWQKAFTNITFGTPKDGPPCLFTIEGSAGHSFSVLETLGTTGLPSLGRRNPPIPASDPSHPEHYNLWRISKTKTLNTKNGPFILPMEIVLDAMDMDGKKLASGFVCSIDESSIKLLDKPLDQSYFTIPVTAKVQIFDADAGVYLQESDLKK